MVRYPFKTAYIKFMDAYDGVYSKGMWNELWRRYERINRNLEELYKQGEISTVNPAMMTAEDIKSYARSQRIRGLQAVSISHDISAIGNICKFAAGNNCTDIARKRYPLLFRQKRHVIGPIMEREDFDRLTDLAGRLTPDSGWQRVRAYGAVLLAIGAGLRTEELQYTQIENLDPQIRFIFVERVKGWESYGESRTIPIRPEVREGIRFFLETRAKQPAKISSSPFIFASNFDRPITTNRLRQDLKIVSSDLDFNFDYRLCRRTYSQYLIDENFSKDYTASVMGHASVKTLERNYAKPRDDRVVRCILNVWSKEEKQKEEGMRE